MHAEIELNPRPRKFLKWIRRFSFKPLDIDYFSYDDKGDLLSFDYEIRPLGFWTQSGEFFQFEIQRRAEGLREPFQITETTAIPEGEYWMNRLEIQASTFKGRAVSFDTYINWGDFYAGSIIESQFAALWRRSKYLTTTLAYQETALSYRKLHLRLT